MKFNVYLLLLFNLFMGGYLIAQSCHGDTDEPATAKFAGLSKEAAFRDAHELPANLPANITFKGEMIALPIAEGDEGNAYFLKANQESDKYIFVFQEWWGLNDYIKAEADRLFEALEGKVNVLAIDLYDGKIATTRKAAAELMQAAKPERCETLIRAAIKFAGEKAKIASIGWCFGGGWSIQAAILLEQQNAGCVMFYGMPEKDKAKLEKLNTDVLAIYATEDKWINKAVADEFEKNMQESGKKVKSLFYEADHAFCNPSSPRFQEAAAQKANAAALDYLKKHL